MVWNESVVCGLWFVVSLRVRRTTDPTTNHNILANIRPQSLPILFYGFHSTSGSRRAVAAAMGFQIPHRLQDSRRIRALLLVLRFLLVLVPLARLVLLLLLILRLVLLLILGRLQQGNGLNQLLQRSGLGGVGAPVIGPDSSSPASIGTNSPCFTDGRIR